MVLRGCLLAMRVYSHHRNTRFATPVKVFHVEREPCEGAWRLEVCGHELVFLWWASPCWRWSWQQGSAEVRLGRVVVDFRTRSRRQRDARDLADMFDRMDSEAGERNGA